MKVFITDCDHENIDQETKVFKDNGVDFNLLQCKTEEDLIRECKGGNVLVNQYAPLTGKVLEALSPDLKLVVRYGVGVDNVDLVKATELGVQVCNVPDYGMNEVADHAMGLLLSLARKTCSMNQYTKNENWDYSVSVPIYRLADQVAGVVGIGRIGRCFINRINGFGAKIIAWDPRFKENEIVDINGINVKIVSFEELIRESDLISIHCPLDENTHHMFNKEAFEKMKPTSYIVNTARGGIIDEEDLYQALEEKLIGGAAIDVFENEPMSCDSKLYKFENMISTPHMAWYSEQAAEELKRKVAEEACRYLKKEELHYPVNNLL